MRKYIIYIYIYVYCLPWGPVVLLVLQPAESDQKRRFKFDCIKIYIYEILN